MLTKSPKHLGRWRLPTLKRKRRRKILQSACRRLNSSCRNQLIENGSLYRNDPSNGAAAIGHLERLPCFDPAEVSAGVLSELTDTDPLHVLHGSTYGKEEVKNDLERWRCPVRQPARTPRTK